MSKLTLSVLQAISDSAGEVIKAVVGKSERAHPADSEAMIRLWDDLNDRHAPPAVVKAMADELINLRQRSHEWTAQRIRERRCITEPVAAIEMNGKVSRCR